MTAWSICHPVRSLSLDVTLVACRRAVFFLWDAICHERVFVLDKTMDPRIVLGLDSKRGEGPNSLRELLALHLNLPAWNLVPTHCFGRDMFERCAGSAISRQSAGGATGRLPARQAASAVRAGDDLHTLIDTGANAFPQPILPLSSPSLLFFRSSVYALCYFFQLQACSTQTELNFQPSPNCV